MAKGAKTGGRRKGTPNKLTGALREMIRDALDAVGGVEYLKAQAAENPTAFLTLVGKILPTEIDAAHSGTIEVVRREVKDA